jgi:hypothetical protein
MRRFALVLAAFLMLLTVFLSGQDRVTCNYIVKEVSFENSAGLTVDQLTALRKLVIGQRYDPDNAMFIGERVYDQLRLWGYCKAKVYDPDKFRVLDADIQPSPIAVVVDFELTDSDANARNGSAVKMKR